MMAKKKSSKTKIATKTTETTTEETQKAEAPKEVVEVVKKAPAIEQGLITIAFTPEELSNFTNLMSITAQTFENLAMQAAQQNDETTYAILAARHKLSSAYATRLMQFAKMGEPSSRDFH